MANEWISAEKPPPEEEYVLLVSDGQVFEGFWSSAYKSRWRSTRYPGCPLGKPVDYWMALPNAPSEPKSGAKEREEA